MGKVTTISTNSPDENNFHGMSRIRKAIAKHNALQKQKTWQDSMTFEARKSIMIRFARAIFPPSDENATTSTLPGKEHFEYARQMEHQIFECACSYDEYIKMIGAEISKVAETWTYAEASEPAPKKIPVRFQVLFVQENRVSYRSPYSVESLIS